MKLQDEPLDKLVRDHNRLQRQFGRGHVLVRAISDELKSRKRNLLDTKEEGAVQQQTTTH
jgi:hypothetical protein